MKISISLILCILLLLGCVLVDPCNNHVIDQNLSPNQKHKAIIFVRDCGATSGWSTQISIIPNDKNIGKGKGNVLIISDTYQGPEFEDGGAKALTIWKSEHLLEIYYNLKEDVFKSEHQIDGINVVYKQLPNE